MSYFPYIEKYDEHIDYLPHAMLSANLLSAFKIIPSKGGKYGLHSLVLRASNVI